MANRLQHESSPYLLQHANNPVDWHPWGEEALNKAKQQDKLLLISIGYAACHWCHVMEHESFEDDMVAQVMNDNFVCIKIDREERPDIDQVYMDAVTLMTGHGGWPLNCIALPDGRPVSGGTYFPKDRWTQYLQQLSDLYHQEPERFVEAATNITGHMHKKDELVKVEEDLAFSKLEIEALCRTWLEQIDIKFGGRKSANNKFPLPFNNLFLLRAANLLQESAPELALQIEEAVHVTLEKMAFGGIYDQIGGGFSRYSVDPYWKVPHFEKMLYDNGQLVSLYAEAYQAIPSEQSMKRELYKRVVYQTLEYIEREMRSPEGGYYASLDADSEGVEGKFYVWTYPELLELLGDDAKQFASYYNAHPHGNWEESNVLYVLEHESQFAKQWDLDKESFSKKLEACRKTLFEARSSRIRPGLDDKILASWNGLMLKGYVDAYRVFADPQFLQAALDNARFIEEKLSNGGQLYRNYKDGKATINAFLDDYANVIDAYLALYQITFDQHWFDQATLHMAYVQEHFFNVQTGMFFYTSDEDPALVNRKTEVSDDVIPSSNSMLAHSLYTMGLILHKEAYRSQAQQMLKNLKEEAVKHPAWHANWSLLMLRYAFPHYEVAITGKDAPELRQAFEQWYQPNRIFAGAKTENDLPILAHRFGEKDTIYVCQGQTCKLPVHTAAEAKALMS